MTDTGSGTLAVAKRRRGRPKGFSPVPPFVPLVRPEMPADGSDAEWGPAMQALNERQQRFVVELYRQPSKVAAAKMSGYVCSSAKSWSALAARLAASDKIQAALRECDGRFLRAASPRAIRALANMVEDSKHPSHARAVEAVLSRTMPVQTVHHVKSEHQHRVTLSPDAVLRRIDELLIRAGLAPQQLPPLIEATITNVVESDDAVD